MTFKYKFYVGMLLQFSRVKTYAWNGWVIRHCASQLRIYPFGVCFVTVVLARPVISVLLSGTMLGFASRGFCRYNSKLGREKETFLPSSDVIRVPGVCYVFVLHLQYLTRFSATRGSFHCSSIVYTAGIFLCHPAMYSQFSYIPHVLARSLKLCVSVSATPSLRSLNLCYKCTYVGR